MSAPSLLTAIPLMHVTSSVAAEDFYCGRLGFTKDWEYRSAAPDPDPGYLGLSRDGVMLHVSSFSGDGVSGAVATFHVRDVDALFTEFSTKDFPIELPPHDQTWGNREMYLRDPDGNSLRFIQRPHPHE